MIETQNFQHSAEKLLDGIAHWPEGNSVAITGLSVDSRVIKPGDLFIAHAGPVAERQHYINYAINQGAVAALREATEHTPAYEIKKVGGRNVPIIAVHNLRAQVGLIASRFYNSPSAQIQMIGITGTNGKTSCSQFIARGLQAAGYPCGVIGTLGSGFPDQLSTQGLTTPDATALHHELANFKEQGAKCVAMEVSSHSLVQHRVAGVQFKIAVFTNLTRDHLDFHGTMENYGNAKEQLFLQPGLKYAVINADDPFGAKLLATYGEKLSCFAYTADNVTTNVPTISAHNIKFQQQGFSATIKTPWGEGVLHSNLLGRFNLSNLLATIATLGIMEIPLDKILQYLGNVPTVNGRMQALGGGKLPLVVVDYAHTPDALEKSLKALREHCSGQLWCVFGCGGNRDKGKRELMGQIAERFSDQLIITDDNPRFENPEIIVEDITKGLLCPWAAEIEHNRRAAIAHAIDCAGAHDVVLIAGKGHEQFQQICSERIPFNDVEQAELQLKLKMEKLTTTS